MIGYFYNIYDPVAPVVITYKTGHYCSLQGSHLGKTEDDFIPGYHTQHLPALWKMVIRDEASMNYNSSV